MLFKLRLFLSLNKVLSFTNSPESYTEKGLAALIWQQVMKLKKLLLAGQMVENGSSEVEGGDSSDDRAPVLKTSAWGPVGCNS